MKPTVSRNVAHGFQHVTYLVILVEKHFLKVMSVLVSTTFNDYRILVQVEERPTLASLSSPTQLPPSNKTLSTTQVALRFD